jgi:uncharacterized membrane protein YkgB
VNARNRFAREILRCKNQQIRLALGAIISVPGIHGMRYMSNLGLFLFKDVIALGVSLYLVSYFGKKAILSENKC